VRWGCGGQNLGTKRIDPINNVVKCEKGIFLNTMWNTNDRGGGLVEVWEWWICVCRK